MFVQEKMHKKLRLLELVLPSELALGDLELYHLNIDSQVSTTDQQNEVFVHFT